jgi:hypothetical protein
MIIMYFLIVVSGKTINHLLIIIFFWNVFKNEMHFMKIIVHKINYFWYNIY